MSGGHEIGSSILPIPTKGTVGTAGRESSQGYDECARGPTVPSLADEVDLVRRDVANVEIVGSIPIIRSKDT